MNKSPLSLKQVLLILLVGFIIIPAILIVYLWIGRVDSLAELPMRLWTGSIVMAVFVCIYMSLGYRLFKRRFDRPLEHFLATLEDISEGFIVANVPQPIFIKAEASISNAFAKVLQINHQMLKNVDNLEKGFEEERLAKLQQIKLTQAYERFVPHEFIRFLQKRNITEVQQGDHIKTEMTVMFVDIRAFTSLSERISAEESFQLLNSYFMRMEPIIQRNYGFIDKFIGDGIMALFHQDPDASIQAAIEMIIELSEYNASRTQEGYEPIQIGVGINTGSLMLGIVGGKNRMEGTVISDAVNVASRIEDLNKTYNTNILISEATYKQLRESNQQQIRLIDKVEVKGKANALLVFEVFSADAAEIKLLKQAQKAQFEQAVVCYHLGQISEANQSFRILQQIAPEDKLVLLYIERCEIAQLNQRQVNEDETKSK